jgi:hypothetical protein
MYMTPPSYWVPIIHIIQESPLENPVTANSPHVSAVDRVRLIRNKDHCSANSKHLICA